MKSLSELEVLSMLCNIKSLTSRCLAGGGHRWISVSQNIATGFTMGNGRGGATKWSESEGRLFRIQLIATSVHVHEGCKSGEIYTNSFLRNKGVRSLSFQRSRPMRSEKFASNGCENRSKTTRFSLSVIRMVYLARPCDGITFWKLLKVSAKLNLNQL